MAKKTTTSKKPGTKATTKPAAKAAPKAPAKASAKAAPKANAKSSTKPGKTGAAGSSSKSTPAKNPPSKAVKDAKLTTTSQTTPTTKPTSKSTGKSTGKSVSNPAAKSASTKSTSAKSSAKESAKAPSKQAPQAAAKPGAKAPAKSSAKPTVAAVAETKPTSKSPSKAPAKPEKKANSKPDAKAEGKTETKFGTKSDAKAESKQPDPKLDPKAAAAAAGRKGITVVTPKPQRKPSTKSSASKFVSPGGNLLGPGLPARKPLIPSGPSATRPVSLGDGADLAGKKSPFNKKELARFKALLLAKRVELIGDVNNMENEALRSSAGSLSNLPQHMADQGSDAYDQSLALDLAAADRRLIKEIDDALQRIEDGTYGLCEITGQPIKIDRLDEIPWARHSIEAAREVERRTHRL